MHRKTYSAPLPQGATVTVNRQGERVAAWTGRDGKKKTAIVFDGQDGKPRVRLQTKTYYAKTRTSKGTVKETATGCRDKDAARAMASEVRSRTERVRAGIVSAAEDQAASHAGDRLVAVLTDFEAALRARGCGKEHIQNVKGRLDRLIKDTNTFALRDLTPARVESWLAEQASTGMAAQTRNHYRTDVVSFGNWLCRAKRLVGVNPFESIPTANVSTDRRHVRRAFTVEEATAFLHAARLRPLAEYGRLPVKGESDPANQKRTNWHLAPLTPGTIEDAAASARVKLDAGLVGRLERLGEERALIYQTLLGTGLRRVELSRVRCVDVDLDSAAIHLRPEDAKNRQGATLPLRPDLIEGLKAHLARKLADTQAVARCQIIDGKRAPIPATLPEGEKLFTTIPGMKVFDADLAAAGIAKIDGRGRVLDVHALRTTFCSWLQAAGVSLRTAQAAMRHSDPKLTACTYTDPALLDIGAAVNALPTLPDKPRPEAVRKAAGTEDMETDDFPDPNGKGKRPPAKPCTKLAPAGGFPCHSEAFPVASAKKRDFTRRRAAAAITSCPDASKAPVSSTDTGVSLEPAQGFEPWACALRKHCSTTELSWP